MLTKKILSASLLAAFALAIPGCIGADSDIDDESADNREEAI